jgi:hypothetical protein
MWFGGILRRSKAVWTGHGQDDFSVSRREAEAMLCRLRAAEELRADGQYEAAFRSASSAAICRSNVVRSPVRCRRHSRPRTAISLPCTALRDADFAQPTLAELLNTLFASLDDEALSKQTS